MLIIVVMFKNTSGVRNTSDASNSSDDVERSVTNIIDVIYGVYVTTTAKFMLM
jgi:hypothetical protein